MLERLSPVPRAITLAAESDEPVLPKTLEPEEPDTGPAFDEALALQEGNRLLHLGWPIFLFNALNYFISFISVAFMGRLGKRALSGGVLANSFANVSGLSIITGTCATCETFCGQLYGAKSYRSVGIYAQRCFFITLIATIPISIVWLCSPGLLRAFGQDPGIADAAGEYLRSLIPVLPLFAASETLRKFLLAQNIVRPVFYIGAATLAVCPAFNALFIFGFGWGLRGAAWALVSCHLVGTSLTAGYVFFVGWKGVERCWPGWDAPESRRQWKEFLDLAVPTTAMLCLEWWIYEAAILASGFLPNPELCVSVMGVCFQVTATCYMIPYGLGSATSIRVSNELGRNRPNAARLATRVSLDLHLLFEFFFFPAVLALHRYLPMIFTSDSQVINLASKALIPLAFSLVGDACNSCLTAAIRGTGRQHFGAVVSIISWWGFGAPLIGVLAFVAGPGKGGMGVVGMWLGLAIASCCQTVVLAVIVLKWLNFKKEAERAVELARLQLVPGGIEAEGGAQAGAQALALGSDADTTSTGGRPSTRPGHGKGPHKDDAGESDSVALLAAHAARHGEGCDGAAPSGQGAELPAGRDPSPSSRRHSGPEPASPSLPVSSRGGREFGEE